MTALHPNPATDADLLRRYGTSRSPDAFAALVDRYLPLIYSAAMRQTRDPHLADDVTQATLIVLSRKAAGIDPPTLPGWLVRTTHYAALNARRQRARRASHEQRAAAMNKEHHTPDPAADADAVSKSIDAALASLGDADRTAVVLRYFQGKSFADVAAQLHTTEQAAQRRISRALDKLRSALSRRGVPVAPAAFPVALAAQMPHSVPAAVALKALAVPSSTNAFASLVAKGALHAMAATKLKITVAIVASVLLAGVAVPTAYRFATARPVLAAAPLPPGTDMTRPVAGSLPPGMTVEPLAIMNLADNRWTRPTGGPLGDLPVDPQALISHLRIQGATHALLFRVIPPTDGGTWTYSVPEASSYGSSSTYDAKTHAQYDVIVLAPKFAATSATLVIRAATGPWTNNVIIPADATTPTTGSLAGNTVTFDAPLQDGKLLHVARGRLHNSGDLCTEFYAVDTLGKRVPFHGMSDNGIRSIYDFQGTQALYKEFRLNSRPYNYQAAYPSIPLVASK